MSSAPPPDDLQRELERVRAAQAGVPSPAQPSVAQQLKKPALRALLLWAALIALFLACHFLLSR